MCIPYDRLNLSYGGSKFEKFRKMASFSEGMRKFFFSELAEERALCALRDPSVLAYTRKI
jgi:hypothetical protein